jgi:hypothetical protein
MALPAGQIARLRAHEAAVAGDTLSGSKVFADPLQVQHGAALGVQRGVVQLVTLSARLGGMSAFHGSPTSTASPRQAPPTLTFSAQSSR